MLILAFSERGLNKHINITNNINVIFEQNSLSIKPIHKTKNKISNSKIT